jgi:hypothetical protein
MDFSSQSLDFAAQLLDHAKEDCLAIVLRTKVTGPVTFTFSARPIGVAAWLVPIRVATNSFALSFAFFAWLVSIAVTANGLAFGLVIVCKEGRKVGSCRQDGTDKDCWNQRDNPAKISCISHS